MNDLKKYFLLNPEVIFLNHGSFGATPIPVFNAYQEWQRQLESQPVKFFNRTFREADLLARQSLADLLHVSREDLVFVSNATYGINLVARSLRFSAEDEILTTNHEYGAVNYTWEYLVQHNGATYIQAPIPLPIQSQSDLLEQFWQYVSPRTRLISISHITSPTALRLPVEAICSRARQSGIITLIDGAHSPGQIELDLDEIGADFYIGNCHKWLLSPKGAGFIYARPSVQHLVQPLVVSWGYKPTPEHTHGSTFLDNLLWTGTHDPAAALAVPDAIRFQHEHAWDSIRDACHALLCDAITRIEQITYLQPAYPLDMNFFSQMAIAPLPKLKNAAQFKDQLAEQYHIEIPVIQWNGEEFLRISIQGYNTTQDVDCLVEALEQMLPKWTA